MAEYTPTTDIVRFRYTEYPYVAQIEDEPGDPAEIDRWLAQHDAERDLRNAAMITEAVGFINRGLLDSAVYVLTQEGVAQ